MAIHLLTEDAVGLA